ncbi:MAG: site-specific DNA-methyltransferase [Humidesulfovibrio sp.]|uniref:site-specific DNA-methyltransferase n=1 Tax=Humidesulfovibrio sp. TaxID=2910988 RepID=UPI0027343564|nr:site-specific DNA-methyltransferase [Humidesulfovibrio sp.]MDP2846605.1 site-specific DNA-methyltransferase [Humidesulfovibrio sp.]
MAKTPTLKSVETITHADATRKNIPTAEFQALMTAHDKAPVQVRYERNRDLDPQLMWRGKDEQDWSDLVVNAPPLYIQEKVHPKVLIDDLLRRTKEEKTPGKTQYDLFANFNGLPNEEAKTEFYQHDANWTNRMILGDSLQVMGSLAEREGLRGKVQCIYFDPPYGIKFNSNFQWSTASRDVKDGNIGHITREPEQVKAFRDTWRDGIHSYLAYLRDRITVARDLLTETGSMFVQIGDENVHRVRAILDEVFGDANYCTIIPFRKRQGRTSASLLPEQTHDFLLWYAKDIKLMKYKQLYIEKAMDNLELFYDDNGNRVPLTDVQKSGRVPLPVPVEKIYTRIPLELQNANSERKFSLSCWGKEWVAPPKGWSATKEKLEKLIRIDRLTPKGKYLLLKRYYTESSISKLISIWNDTAGEQNAEYVVQTSTLPIQRCLLMTTDPGDLVLDPTCGSGTTAYVAEQFGRRWVTIDTSRVALALARSRIIGAKYPYYYLRDSIEGQNIEAELSHKAPSSQPVFSRIRFGFVYGRAPHITLNTIAKNVDIDNIVDKYGDKFVFLLNQLSREIGKTLREWEIPHVADPSWGQSARDTHLKLRELCLRRQREIDASIVAKADFEPLYDKPCEDKKKVRVAGPFTVESLSPHRVLAVDENDDLIDPAKQGQAAGGEQDFVQMILENLKTAGVQQAHKDDKIAFTSLVPWPGVMVCAEGRYIEGDGQEAEKRAAIFIGPEFGTVSRPDLVEAAREAGEAGFDVLIACAFNYDAHSTEFSKLGRIPVLKARMNADLHMSDELKNTGKGNLFVIFGEPDIDIIPAKDGQIQVKVKGVDVFHPNTGEVRSDGPDGIACWFIDSDYNEESFFVRQAYFLGANDPYKALKTTLKAEINAEAWETLNSDTSRPFDKPKDGRIAVKVINHLGDEVMKVFRV